MAEVLLHRLKENTRLSRLPEQHEAAQRTTLETTVEGHTELGELHSLETMKVLLAVSFGCIAYLRDLLPHESLAEERFELDSAVELTYEGFKAPAPSTTAERKGVLIRKIIRGVCKDADGLLDVLETGVFDALSRKFLSAVQLNIFLDENHPEELVESYVFHVRYRDKASSMPGGNSGAAHGGDESVDEISGLMKNLILNTRNLTALPETKHLTVRLFYDKSAPLSYSPPVFKPNTNPQPNIFVTEGSSQYASEAIGEGALDHHVLAVDISAVEPLPDGSNYQTRRPRRRIYQNLSFLETLEIENEVPGGGQPSDQGPLYSQPFSQDSQQGSQASRQESNSSIDRRLDSMLADSLGGTQETEAQAIPILTSEGLAEMLSDSQATISEFTGAGNLSQQSIRTASQMTPTEDEERSVRELSPMLA